jgi:hypothetical protein
MKKILFLLAVVGNLMLSCGAGSGEERKSKQTTEKAPDKLDVSELEGLDDLFPSPGELISEVE